MKNKATFIFLTFWVIVATIGPIISLYTATHHPYLSAALVAVWVAFYSMSGRK